MSKLFSTSFICILFLSLLAASCKKNEQNGQNEILPTDYKGLLVDLSTRTPIANNKVYLITWASERLDPSKLWTLEYADTSLILQNTPKGTVDSAITDIAGMFSFAYPPNITPQDFLNIYWPTLGNHNPNYCFVKRVLNKYPYNYLDTFFTETPCVLKIKMQKSSALSPTDITFQKIDFYQSSGFFIQKQYFMGQKGKTNHTVEIPYSKNLANQADIEFHFVDNGPTLNIQKFTITLQPSGTTNLTILY